MTTTEIRHDLSLTVEKIIAAPPEHVFNAWLSGEMMQRFMLPGPDMSVPKATVDAREGGRFDIIMRDATDDMPHGGVFRTITPHSKIVFTWESDWSPAESEVTLDFVAVSGGTHVTLTHVTFLDELRRDNHQMGWTRILETLAGLYE